MAKQSLENWFDERLKEARGTVAYWQERSAIIEEEFVAEREARKRAEHEQRKLEARLKCLEEGEALRTAEHAFNSLRDKIRRRLDEASVPQSAVPGDTVVSLYWRLERLIKQREEAREDAGRERVKKLLVEKERDWFKRRLEADGYKHGTAPNGEPYWIESPIFPLRSRISDLERTVDGLRVQGG